MQEGLHLVAGGRLGLAEHACVGIISMHGLDADLGFLQTVREEAGDDVLTRGWRT